MTKDYHHSGYHQNTLWPIWCCVWVSTRIRNKLKWAPTPYKYTVKSGSAKRLKVIATEGFILFEMVSSRQDGLLQDKVTFLPDKLELTGLQFPLTTNSSPITRSVFPFPWLYSILPAYQFTWTRRAVSCALPFLFEITFITTNNPSAIRNTFCIFGSWKPLLRA